MIRFIEYYRDRFGVETICRVLGATECGFLTARGYRPRRPGRRQRGHCPISCSAALAQLQAAGGARFQIEEARFGDRRGTLTASVPVVVGLPL